MRIKTIFMLTLGIIGCGGTTGVGGNQPPKRDMNIVFDDLGPPPDLDPGPQNACGDHDPNCQSTGWGPDNGTPFPLPGDQNVDPNLNLQADGVGRSNPAGYLVLDQTKSSFNYLWIANSDEGTVSKIDSRNVKEVARYLTSTCFSTAFGSKNQCDGKNGCCALDSNAQWQNRKNKQPDGPSQQVQTQSNSPSRTAVDFNGDLFVHNRAFGGQPSVTKVANDMGTCKDRNKNGRIDTSSDVDGDGVIAKDCNGNGRLDDIDDVKQQPCFNGKKQEFFGLDDECILWTTNDNSYNSVGRPMGLGPGAVDNGPSDVWPGGYNNGVFYRIDGITGKTKDEVHLPGGCQPYGLAVDSSGYGWAPNLGCCSLCYFDTRKNTNVGVARGQMQGYGITLDRDQNIWVGSGVARYTPDRSNGFANLGNGWWTRINGLGGIGIAADSRNAKKYFVWSCNGQQITRIPASDIPMVKMDQNIGNAGWLTIPTQCYGVGVDNDQNVWGVPQASTITRTKIDMNGDMPKPPAPAAPAPNTRCPAGDMCDLSTQHYTYSDFTGFGLRNFTRPSGNYSFIVKGCIDGSGSGATTSWVNVTWDADVPPNTQLTLRTRTGSTPKPDNTWGQWSTSFDVSPADLSNGAVLPNGPDSDSAYYMQVEFTFKTNDRAATPKLKALSVAYKCGRIG